MQNESSVNTPPDKALTRKELVSRVTSIFSKELSQFHPKSQKIILAHFENPHKTLRDLARDCGCSEQWVGRVLNSSRVIQFFRALGRRKLESLIPQSTKVISTLLTPEMTRAEPGEARKAAEVVLRETKILGAHEVIVTNRFENMSHSDLKHYLNDSSALPEPVIEAELVQDDHSDGQVPS